MDVKVADYPHLRKRGAGFVNTDRDGYARALTNRRSSQRLTTVENEVRELTKKVDRILDLLESLRPE